MASTMPEIQTISRRPKRRHSRKAASTSTSKGALPHVAIVVVAVTGWLTLGCSMLELDNAVDRATPEEAEHKPETEAVAPDALANSDRKVRWDGGGVLLGESDSLAYTPETFLSTVVDLFSEERYASLKHLVRAYPDIALRSLQQIDAPPQDLPALQTTAVIFDELWCQATQDPWQKFLAYRLSTDRDAAESWRLHGRFWTHLRTGEPKPALDLRLTQSLPRNADPMFRADCYRLEAVALMMNDEPSKATSQLQRALKLVNNASPYQASQLTLLLGEFHRHSGEADRWKTAWQEAVLQHSQLLLSERLFDPDFWSRAAFLRPAGLGWPDRVISNLTTFLRSRSIDAASSSPDCVVWMTIGIQHLARGEGQNAVLALKKAEALSRANAMVAQLQLHQARAMVLAGQPGAASAILFRLIGENRQELISDRAKAILGALKLQNGGVAQGFNLLDASIKTSDGWPSDERLRARADYSLALLIRGREKQGLQLLDQVQQEFESVGEFEQSRQCLWNKALYFERTEQDRDREAALAALQDFETRQF